MPDDIEAIVEKLPPPGKTKPAAEGDEPSGDAEYSAEEDSAMEVASALGADPAKVDVPRLCEALKGFIQITGG